MAWQRFEWQDRVTEHPNYRRLTDVNDESNQKVYRVERAEGEVISGQTGTPLNATRLNDLEGRINDMNTSLFGSIETVTLPANGWTPTEDSRDGYTITVQVQGVTAVSNQEIFGLPATSQENIDNNTALQALNLMDAGQALGTITLFTKTLPTANLQIRVLVRT